MTYTDFRMETQVTMTVLITAPHTRPPLIAVTTSTTDASKTRRRDGEFSKKGFGKNNLCLTE